MSTAERKAIKAGKRQRIRTLLKNIIKPEPVVEDQPWFADVLRGPVSVFAVHNIPREPLDLSRSSSRN